MQGGSVVATTCLHDVQPPVITTIIFFLKSYGNLYHTAHMQRASMSSGRKNQFFPVFMVSVKHGKLST